MAFASPAFVAYTENITFDASGLTQNKPAGVAQGDVLVSAVYASCTRGTLAAPAGWTRIGRGTLDFGGATIGEADAWWKVAGASEPSTYAWTGSAVTDCGVVMAAFRNIDAAAIGGAGQTPRRTVYSPCNSDMLPAGNFRVIRPQTLFVGASINGDAGLPSGWTRANGAGMFIQIAYKLVSAAGDYDSGVWTPATGAGEENISSWLMLPPVPFVPAVVGPYRRRRAA